MVMDTANELGVVYLYERRQRPPPFYERTSHTGGLSSSWDNGNFLFARRIFIRATNLISRCLSSGRPGNLMSVREGMVSREIAPSIFMSSSVRLRASPQETRL